MASQNSFTQSEGFVNLLNSQFNTDSYSPSIDLGSSDIPVFSTQGTDDPAEPALKRKVWSPKEDLILISSWLNTSKDPIVGNEQRAGAFWKRIQVYYNNNEDLVGLPRREWSQCKQRWGRINDQVCKFVGSYAAAQKEKRSGQNENDVMKLAHEIFSTTTPLSLLWNMPGESCGSTRNGAQVANSRRCFNKKKKG
ncbi:glutathione S-transferase T3-like [Eutrema salsugineum]|uniref:glutathione S-transferase T3-like n=1 Tax=Eutrema salsugineum TaxID=72664 RepID=UPI000CED74DF|nr:glutathione S-transferase T3-like [Eutrema salsugineum]